MPRGELNNSPLRLVQNSSSVSAGTLESLHSSQGLASQELQKDSIIGSTVRCNSMAFLSSSCWSWNSNTLATSCEELTHWKRPWYWEGLGAGGEGDDRGWDGWMASPTRWTWVWVNSGSWWWTGRPGVLRFMGSQGVGPAWATELNWTELRKEFIRNVLTSLYYAFHQNVFLSSRWDEFFEMNPIACLLCHLTSWGEDWKFSFQPPKVSTNISAFNCLYLINW